MYLSTDNYMLLDCLEDWKYKRSWGYSSSIFPDWFIGILQARLCLGKFMSFCFGEVMLNESLGNPSPQNVIYIYSWKYIKFLKHTVDHASLEDIKLRKMRPLNIPLIIFHTCFWFETKSVQTEFLKEEVELELSLALFKGDEAEVLSLALMLLVMLQSHYICSLIYIADYKVVIFLHPASAKVLRFEIGKCHLQNLSWYQPYTMAEC